MNKKLKHWLIGILGLLVVLGGLLFGAGMYFYNVAVVPSQKSFISNKPVSKKSPLYPGEQWYKNDAKKILWKQQSVGGNLTLDANFLPAAHKTNKTVIVAHGFMGNKEKMAPYAYMFHKMGYNVLTPDTRGQGKSEGNYIGYGWPDRLDYIKWMHKVIDYTGKNSKLFMFGVSMGGATTMMVSGEKVPTQLKGYIEDCGYTSITDELNYQAQQLYHLPAFPRWPLIPILSGITHVRAGYSMYDGSALKQVRKNHLPMMFIHGSNDTFVPTKMVYPLYRATRGPKELLIVKGAKHADAYQTNPKLYNQKVEQFINKYMN
ncbi:alpha/beta hydrolase [Apilactobacillus sp. M161]|uniref:Alpha/beta hydrolase n=1 Tax=Apilactobacillus xinyiensis TaxID=2841032 RepID=A0ABT0I2M7_9LACO|nr:alpha/beta hydrolase [Apilactobacillus xinyiensis]MCK8624951.1 alpha/beta hydrolase [Apilactobacillus xinyiensis]